MANQEEFKIRVLPRTSEPRREGATKTGKRSVKRFAWPRINLKVLIFGLIFFAASFAIGLLLHAPKTKSHEMASEKIVRDPTAVRIDRLVEESRAREDFLHKQRELGNLRSKEVSGDVDPTATAPEAARSFGVQLDSENTAEKMYEELNERPTQHVDNTPDNRINAMLEKNKWLNQQERQERVQYVRNFIKTAYDRGYEVDLDQNLQVVGVRPIATRRISLEEAIEKATRQGF